MNDRIKESDWRKFKELRPLALQRYCQRVIDEVKDVLDKQNPDSHDQYLEVFNIVHGGDKKLARMFDQGFSRSKAFEQLLMYYGDGLLRDDEIEQLSEENCNSIKSIVSSWEE